MKNLHIVRTNDMNRLNTLLAFYVYESFHA